LRGTVTPTVVAGRAPSAPGEIALGTVTMQKIGKHIGDTVKLSYNGMTRGFEVVGRVALPRIAEPQPLADGAALTAAGLTSVIAHPEESQTHYLVVTVAPGAARGPVNHRLAAIDRRTKAGGGFPNPAHGPQTPVEVSRLRQINWFPATLAVLLATLALLAIGHALVTSVRRRRRELALLKTMGFDRRQLSATVAWQATTLALVGLIVGIPIGLLVGNAVWNAVADGLGISPASTIPIFALAVTVVAALVLANVIAFFPARSAAKTPAAVALRSE
jgi:hypothetical protein